MGETVLGDGQANPQELRTWFSGLSLGPLHRIGELTLAPLLQSRIPPEPDRLIDQAIPAGQLEITEQGKGTVQQILARNHGDSDVLVLEGDTLVGCNQNRMVAWSVLVGARSTVPVSVGCMERGRWGQAGKSFAPGAMAVDPHIRRRSKRETSATVGRLAGPQLDQQRAWSDVNQKLGEWRVASATDDYHAGLLARAQETWRRLRDLKFSATQVGVIALHESRLLGLEAVAHPATWRVLARRVLPAYAVGAESARRDPEFRYVPGSTPGEWLETVSRGAVEARRARGRGYDVVLRNHGITGTCLWHEGFARHLAVFAN